MRSPTTSRTLCLHKMREPRPHAHSTQPMQRTSMNTKTWTWQLPYHHGRKLAFLAQKGCAGTRTTTRFARSLHQTDKSNCFAGPRSCKMPRCSHRKANVSASCSTAACARKRAVLARLPLRSCSAPRMPSEQRFRHHICCLRVWNAVFTHEDFSSKQLHCVASAGSVLVAHHLERLCRSAWAYLASSALLLPGVRALWLPEQKLQSTSAASSGAILFH